MRLKHGAALGLYLTSRTGAGTTRSVTITTIDQHNNAALYCVQTEGGRSATTLQLVNIAPEGAKIICESANAEGSCIRTQHRWSQSLWNHPRH